LDLKNPIDVQMHSENASFVGAVGLPDGIISSKKFEFE
jgi:hypothetical protein